MATPLPLNETLRVSLGIVMAAAGAGGHRLVGIQHGCYALLLEPEAASVMVSCGAELRALEADLQLHFGLGRLCDYRGEQGVPPMSPELSWAVHRAREFRRQTLRHPPRLPSEVTGPDLLLALLETERGWRVADLGRSVMDLLGRGRPVVGEVLSWHGVTIRSVRERLARRGAQPLRLGPPPRASWVEGTHRVVVYDDGRTTMDFVVGVLESRFAYPTGGAVRLMLQAHSEGQAVVGIFDTEGATSRVEAARRDAERAGYPLQLAVEAVG
jgi:ATP-dependent Clp protease adaptor protein ClpS